MGQEEILNFLKFEYLKNKNFFWTVGAIAQALKKHPNDVAHDLRKLCKWQEVEKINIMNVQTYVRSDTNTVTKKIVSTVAYRYKPKK